MISSPDFLLWVPKVGPGSAKVNTMTMFIAELRVRVGEKRRDDAVARALWCDVRSYGVDLGPGAARGRGSARKGAGKTVRGVARRSIELTRPVVRWEDRDLRR